VDAWVIETNRRKEGRITWRRTRMGGRTMSRWNSEVMPWDVMMDWMDWIGGNGRADNHDYMMHRYGDGKPR
jgi:hypothetical protein